MKSVAPETLPKPARAALARLGEDIALARRKRRLTTVSMAERAFISRNTLYKVERGDPTVSIGIYATVLSILGLVERLGEVADRREDTLGLDLQDEALPKSVRGPRKPKSG
jgi:transcriptional regulator with XRE-family HTH domain